MPDLVILRRWPAKEGGDLVALFPEIPFTHEGHVTSYQHIGQHGAACYTGVVKATTPVRPEVSERDRRDAEALLAELRSLGYEPRVIRRYQRQRRAKR